MILMITKLSQGKRNNGLNLRQPFNEQIYLQTRQDLLSVEKTKNLNFNTDMLRKLLPNLNFSVVRVTHTANFINLIQTRRTEADYQIESSIGCG